MPAKVNKFGFDSAACFAAIQQICDGYMTTCAEHLLRIMRRQIEDGGNGSWFMRHTALAQVKEILHEVTDEHIKIRGGIDEDELKGAAEEVYVRVMVVLHGNQANPGDWTTKPGEDTFGKHVVAKGPSLARSKHPLPESWRQFDVSGGIIDNTMKEVEKYFSDMISAIKGALNGSFYAQFVTVR